MKIIIFLNQKGGVGKSTCAFNVAIELAQLGNSVNCVDLDSQGTLTKFFEKRKGDIACKSLSVDDLQSHIDNNKCNYFIIDSQGIADVRLLTFAMAVNALIIVPTSSNSADIDSTKEVLAQLITFKFNYRVLFNKLTPNLSSTRDLLFKQLNDNKVLVLNNYIKDMACHRKSVDEGKSSFEYQGNEEFKIVTNEILGEL